nr:retrovirus-related Pol polyprotein from transposon TNT 1-94 [Tanacetum cinerariifolium]
MKRLPLFEANCFIYWKNRFETYVKSKDIDLWHIIVNGDYKPTIANLNSLVITHQGNKQVKDNKIDLFVQQYKQISISDDETIDCAFARFNTIITYLKALDESFSSHNHVRKFLRALPTKWRSKVTGIKESKDLSTLLLDELSGNLKVYEVVLKKDSNVSKSKKEKYKSLALKAKVSSDEEALCSDSDDEEYAMVVRDFKNYLEEDENSFDNLTATKRPFEEQMKKRKGKKNVGCWSDSDEDDDPKKDEICLMTQDSNEDSGCSRHMTGNNDLFSTYEAINEGTVVFGSNTKSKIIGKEPKNIKEAIKNESWTMAMKEELNQFLINVVWSLVSPPENQTVVGTKWVFKNKLDENGVISKNKARLVAQGYDQQEGIDFDETYAPVARLESIRILLAYACANDFKLFQMDVKSALLNGFLNEKVYVSQPPSFIDFEKPNHVFKLKKALYGLKQAPKAWYDRLKAFLIDHEYTIGLVDNTLFIKKIDSLIIIV